MIACRRNHLPERRAVRRHLSRRTSHSQTHAFPAERSESRDHVGAGGRACVAKSIADATPARGSLLRMSLGRGRMGVMDGRGHSTVNAARHSKLNARAVGEQSALAPLPVSGISPAQVVRGLHPFGLVTACRCFSSVRHRIDPAFVARFPSRSARRRLPFSLRPAAALQPDRRSQESADTRPTCAAVPAVYSLDGANCTHKT